jgi:hypothetical protein
MADTVLARISSESVREATGRDWEWLEELDGAGAAEWDHKTRLTWQPAGWEEPATVQLTISESASGKTAIQAHMEKLPDAEAREAMRERWREALSRLAAAVA